jgi:hypothetical protein
MTFRAKPSTNGFYSIGLTYCTGYRATCKTANHHVGATLVVARSLNEMDATNVQCA